MTGDTATSPADGVAPKPEAEARRFPTPVLAGLITDAYVAAGLPHADAAKVAALMIETDLSGADAHGTFRLPHYVKRIRAGGCNPRPNIRVNRSAAATALIDGDNGMGHLVVARAAETAIELAREAGVAWVGMVHSNHAGSAGIYAAMPVEYGMAGIYAAVASANHMPVWGGAENLLGTNPLAIGVPSAEGPVVLDMATTVVSYGTIKTHLVQNRPLEEGWMVNAKDGKPLIDPRQSAEGLLLPIGGYKGSGLAIMIGILGGILNGAFFGREVVDFNAHADVASNTGQFVIALDIARFMPLDAFKAEVGRHLVELRNSKLLPGFEEIRLPGDRRRECREERLRDGIPIPPPLLAQLDQLAGELGVKPLLARMG